MLADLVERPDDLPGLGVHREVVGQVDAALVEQGVVVRAQAQDVLGDVGPEVRLAECADVGPLGDIAAGDLKPYVADLAVALVELIDRLGGRECSGRCSRRRTNRWSSPETASEQSLDWSGLRWTTSLGDVLPRVPEISPRRPEVP